jgi:hypothetical protein
MKQHDDMFMQIMNLANTIHSDLTGEFPFTSQRGNRYKMIAIHINVNYIFCKPMKKMGGEMIAVLRV